jgi:hypothetical protein
MNQQSLMRENFPYASKFISDYDSIFGSDRMSYVVLRGNWCDIFLSVHEDQSDFAKN